MLVQLSDLNLLTWQWHDAGLYSIRIEYSEEGDLSLYLRTEINEFEDNSQLQELGISTLFVEIQFQRVGFLQLISHADCAMREVILDWDFVKSDPRHHIIKGSCGSIIELKFEDVWLQPLT